MLVAVAYKFAISSFFPAYKMNKKKSDSRSNEIISKIFIGITVIIYYILFSIFVRCLWLSLLLLVDHSDKQRLNRLRMENKPLNRNTITENAIE